jgi:hypothetical protein
MMTEMGAHCKADHMNTRSVGVCFLGNFMEQAPPPEQWTLGARLVSAVCNILDIPKFHVLGHGQVDRRTQCPGDSFDMEAFREILKLKEELR